MPALRYHATTLLVGVLYLMGLYLVLACPWARTIAGLWASLPSQ